jgi:hypothetical protein
MIICVFVLLVNLFYRLLLEILTSYDYLSMFCAVNFVIEVHFAKFNRSPKL